MSDFDLIQIFRRFVNRKHNHSVFLIGQ